MSTAKPGEAGEAARVAVLARCAHGAPSTVGMLSRRDRAAMVLALECCREDNVHPVAAVVSARRALSEGGDAAGALLAASCRISAHDNGRLALARMALALRVLLRVDAGDFGRYLACPDCGDRCRDSYEEGDGLACPKTGRYVEAAWARWRPLWEHAAATGDRRDGSAARAAGGET